MVLQVLRPGGQFLCLEFSPKAYPGLQSLYDFYSFNVIPKIGKYGPRLMYTAVLRGMVMCKPVPAALVDKHCHVNHDHGLKG